MYYVTIKIYIKSTLYMICNLESGIAETHLHMNKESTKMHKYYVHKTQHSEDMKADCNDEKEHS